MVESVVDAHKRQPRIMACV